MNREILKAKIAEVISSTNKSGNEKLEAILTVVDAYSSADNGAKRTGLCVRRHAKTST